VEAQLLVIRNHPGAHLLGENRSSLVPVWVEGLCQNGLVPFLPLPGIALLERGRNVCSVEGELLHIAKIRGFV
jgi:hypothetical protein